MARLRFLGPLCVLLLASCATRPGNDARPRSETITAQDLTLRSSGASELPKKWKFASYFTGVKEKVRGHWKPADAWRALDPSGQRFGRHDRYTMLRIKLQPDGTLVSAAVDHPSGAPELDEIAIRAFEAAAPFPGPPAALVDKTTGLIDFRFGFVFQLDGRGVPRDLAPAPPDASTAG